MEMKRQTARTTTLHTVDHFRTSQGPDVLVFEYYP